MTNLECVISKIVAVDLKADVWVGGSFLTQKIDPEDSDLIVSIDGVYVQSTTPPQRDVLDWIGANLRNSLLCDSYVYFYYPPSHPNYSDGL